MSYVVALTGGIGSGKTTVANAFAELGATLVDADVIARHVVEPGSYALQAIVEHFGAEIINANGSLNRALLRQRIFDNEQEKNWLNALLHPLIQRETQLQIKQASGPYVLWVVPLLIENQLQNQAQRILVVDVDTEIQCQRTMQRDNISQTQAEKIIAAQVSRAERLSYADDVIENSASFEEIMPLVNKLHRYYLTQAIITDHNDDMADSQPL